MLHGSQHPHNSNEQEKNAADDNAAHRTEAGNHVGGLSISGHPDEQEGHHL